MWWTFQAREKKMETVDKTESAIAKPSPRRPRKFHVPCVGQLLGRSSDLQASYWLALPNPWPDQCVIEPSFLLTAAGQFRIFIGFPFHPDAFATGHREVRTTIYSIAKSVNPNLWG
jgi:hypothetical protein